MTIMSVQKVDFLYVCKVEGIDNPGLMYLHKLEAECPLGSTKVYSQLKNVFPFKVSN